MGPPGGVSVLWILFTKFRFSLIDGFPKLQFVTTIFSQTDVYFKFKSFKEIQEEIFTSVLDSTVNFDATAASLAEEQWNKFYSYM